MEGFKKILFPVALTDISPVVAPYVATMIKRFGADLHLLHVRRRFDWFVEPMSPSRRKRNSKAGSLTSAHPEARNFGRDQGVRILRNNAIAGAVGTGHRLANVSKLPWGAIAKGRSAKPGQGAFDLREERAAYNSFFDLDNRDPDPE